MHFFALDKTKTDPAVWKSDKRGSRSREEKESESYSFDQSPKLYYVSGLSCAHTVIFFETK